MMSVDTEQQFTKATSCLTPQRVWPLIAYGVVVLSLYVTEIGTLLFGNDDVSQSFDAFIFAAFATPLALVAMSQVRVRTRIKFFLIIFLIKLITNLCEEFLSLIRYSGGFPILLAYEWVRISLKDLRDFAIVIALAHGLSSLASTFIASRPTGPADAFLPMQARIVDWFYFMTFVGLAFIAPLPFGTLTLDSNRELVFTTVKSNANTVRMAMYFLALIPALGAAATGVFCLSSLSQWRMKLLSVAVIISLSVLCAVYLMDAGSPFFLTLAAVGCAAVLSFPYWLLLRLAGYQLHAPRRSLFSNQAPTSEASAAINP